MLFAPEFPSKATPSSQRRAQTAVIVALGASVIGGAAALATGAGANETVWDRVAACESSGNWAINTGNGYYGGLQFSASTWAGFGGLSFAARADLASKDQQITIAKKVLVVQGPGAWPTCGARAGLTVANGTAVPTHSGNPGGVSKPPPTGPVVPLAVDGVRGPRTNRALEVWVKGSVNASISSYDIAQLQRKVGTTPDGALGPITTKALQRTVGATPDGAWGPMTNRALQAYLNGVLG